MLFPAKMPFREVKYRTPGRVSGTESPRAKVARDAKTKPWRPFRPWREIFWSFDTFALISCLPIILFRRPELAGGLVVARLQSRLASLTRGNQSMHTRSFFAVFAPFRGSFFRRFQAYLAIIATALRTCFHSGLENGSGAASTQSAVELPPSRFKARSMFRPGNSSGVANI